MTTTSSIPQTHRVIAALVTEVLLASAALAGNELVPCSFTVNKIGAPTCPFWGPMSPTPSNLSNGGQWVGFRFQCDLTNTVAIRWSPESGIVNLPFPPGAIQSKAIAVNNLGTVVGLADYRGCIWIGDEIVEIAPQGGSPAHSSANAVNASNVVVGWRSFDGPAFRHGFIWRDGIIQDIAPEDHGATLLEANGISDSGVIVGHLDQLGFRLTEGTFEVLEPLPGAHIAYVKDVNNAGLVIGASEFFDSDLEHLVLRPTIWGQDGQPVELPLLPGYSEGSCLAVNDAGTVLGSVTSPTEVGLPGFQDVVWVDQIPIAIKPLVQGANPAVMGACFGINEAGQVLATGSVTPPGGYGVWILTPQHLSADLTNDCVVDGADLAALLSDWGACLPDAPADLDKNLKVDGVDLGLLLGEWTVQ